MNDKLSKLKEITDILNRDVPSTKEVAELLAQVIKVVMDAKNALESQAERNKKDLSRLVDSSYEDARKNLNNLASALERTLSASLEKSTRDAVKDIKDKTKLELDDLTLKIFQELTKVKNLIPDLLPVYGKIDEVAKKIPKLDEVRVELGSLKENKADKKEIEDVKKEIEAVKALPRGRIGMRKVPVIQSINLTSQLNGSLKAFSLPRDTVRVLGVFGTQFPINFNADTDWTFAGQTLTLADHIGAPESGQTLYALVETLFYA